VLTSRLSAYLDVHLLAHVLSVPVDRQPLRMHDQIRWLAIATNPATGPDRRICTCYRLPRTGMSEE
jgi:hypothetical protein